MLYIYDADGNRVASITDGVRKNYLVDPRGYSKVLQEYDANGQVLTKYFYGLGLIKSESGSDEKFYHSDGLGSTRLLTDGTGQVTDRYVYDAFGRLIANAGASGNAYQFAGEQRDSTGLDYLRGRYYNSDLGRFISKDAFAGHLASPISENAYVYANANPVNFTDPSGYFSLGEVNAAEAINSILSSAAYGAAYSGAANLIIQNAQIVDGKKTDIDGKELLESLGWGALFGAVGGGIGAVPSLRLLGFGIFAGISATSVVKGAIDIGNGSVFSGAAQIALALAPFGSKEHMDSYPGLKAEFNRLVENLASYNINVSRSESGGINVELPRYSNTEALKWDLAEQAGIPRYIDLENPNNVYGVSYENLMQHYQLRGFDVVPKPPKSGTSGFAKVFELPDNPLIKAVQYHPGSETHAGGLYYKFTLRNGTEVRIIQDMVGFKPGTVAPNQRYFNSNGQPIEYNGKEFKVIGE